MGVAVKVGAAAAATEEAAMVGMTVAATGESRVRVRVRG